MKRSSIFTAVILALFSLLIGPGCGSSGGGGGGGTVGDGIDPYVEVLSPNGGEVFNGTSGQTVTITWTASDETALAADPITIAYSTNAGTSYTTIASGEANDGTYTWTLGSDIDGNILIRVTAKDASGRSANDVSDSAVALDATLPTIDTTAPAGNATVNTGDPVAVTWTASDINLGANPISIDYATDHVNGPWTSIVSATANDGSYTWNVPGFGTNTNVFVRVTVTDAAGLSANEKAPNNTTPATITINADATAPTVTSITYGTYGLAANPTLAAATDVPIAEQLIVLFSETMNTTTTASAITLNDGGSVPITIYWTETSAPNDTAIIVSDALLDENTNYTLSVATTAADTAGNTLAVLQTAAFDTVDDMTGPALTSAVTNNGTAITESVLPNGANGIHTFTFTYDETVSSVSEFRIEAVFDDAADYDASIAGNVVTVDIDVDDDGTYGEADEDALTPGRGFILYIEVLDGSGNSTINEWNISTAISPAQSPDAPYLVSSVPAEGGTDIACNLPMYLVFSEALDPSTISSGITVTGPTGVLTIDQIEIMGGSLVMLTVDGGLPGSSAITVALTASLEDCGGTPATAETVLSFTTGSADSTGPSVYSSTVKSNDEDIYPMAGFLVNMDEMVIEDTVDETTVYFEDALSGAPVRSFKAEISSESGELRVYFNGILGSPLAYNRDYNLVVNGLEDISGNTSAISIPFKTVADAGTDYAPYLENFRLEAMLYPEWAMLGTPSNTIGRMIYLEVNIQDDNNQTTSTVTASDGTNPSWTLNHDSGGQYDYGTDYPTDGDEDIETGSGSVTVTIDDTNGHTITYKKNYFIPATIPQQVSPRNAATVDIAAADIPLEWTTPGYSNSVVAISFTKEPGDPFNTDIPALFVNAEETTVDVPSDFGLTTGYYFWSLLFFRPGFDSDTMAINLDFGLVDVFSVIDSGTGSSISGLVTQSTGNTTGDTIVAVFDQGESFESQAPIQVAVLTSIPDSYTLYSLPDGTYDVLAFRDTDGNMDFDGDPSASSLGVVVGGGDVTGVDLDLALLYPDLVVASGSITMPVATIAQGTQMFIGRTLDNTAGTADADSFDVTYYFSTDTLLDGGDYNVGQQNNLSLAQGATNTTGWTITAPAANGTYYLIAEIDSNDEETELNEGNNTTVSAATIAVTTSGSPDLIGSIDSSPSAAYEGQMISVDVSAFNIGSAATGTYYCQLYLSDDGTVDDPGDTLLYTAPGKSITNQYPGNDYQFSGLVDVVLPAGTGTKYLLWMVDSGTTEAESNEGNNVDSVTIDVQTPPDLEADESYAGTYVGTATNHVYVARAGATVSSTVFITEATGVQVDDDFDVDVYISADPTIDPADVNDEIIGTDTYTAPFLAGDTDTLIVSSTIDEKWAQQTVYIGSEIDSADDVFESDETDASNITSVSEAQPLTVLGKSIGAGEYDFLAGDYWADLDDGTGNNNININEVFYVDAQAHCFGDIPAGNVNFGVYFSSDATIDLTDTRVGQIAVTPEEFAMHSEVRIPCTAPNFTGTYYYGTIINYDGAVTEVDDAIGNLNNISNRNTTIDVINTGTDNLDLYPNDGGGGPGATGITVDENFAVPVQIRCDGNGDTVVGFDVTIYASSDTTIDVGDEVLTTVSYPVIGPGYRDSDDMGGEFTICNLTSAIYASLGSPATVTIGYIIDVAGDVTAETDTSNNIKVVYSDITLNAVGAGDPDLMVVMYMEFEDEPGASAPQPPTYYLDVDTTSINLPLLLTANFGEGASVAPDIDFLISSDQTVGGDTTIGTFNDSALAAGEYRFLFNSAAVTLSNLSEGTWNLYGFIDPGTLITESDETNNTSDDVQIDTMQLGSWIPLIIDNPSTPTPELIGSISVDNWGISDKLYISLMVFNTSLDPGSEAQKTVAELWFSEDTNGTVTGGSDEFIGLCDIPVVVPGGNTGSQISLFPDIASFTEGEDYSLKMKVDSLGEVTERDDTDANNTDVYTILCNKKSEFTGGIIGWTVVNSGDQPWTGSADTATVDAAGGGADNTVLLSNSMDFSSSEEVYILFDYSYSPGTNCDFYIEVNDGTDTNRVDDTIWDGTGQLIANLSEYAAGQSTVWVRIVFEAAAGTAGTATVDNVLIISHP